MDPVTIGICPQTSFDHACLSNEQTFDVEEELGDIYKKFDEGKCIEILAPLTKGICSETHSNMRICPMNETVKNDETGEDDKAEATEASERENLS